MEGDRPLSRTPPRRGIRSGVRARARRSAWVLHQAAEQNIDPLSVPVVHAGGVSRPLYTSRFWEPHESEAEPAEEEEEEEVEVVVTRHGNVIDFASLQAEELVPRARLWRPTSKAKASAVRYSQLPVDCVLITTERVGPLESSALCGIGH